MEVEARQIAREYCPDVAVKVEFPDERRSYRTREDSHIHRAIAASILEADSSAAVVPFVSFGGTDLNPFVRELGLESAVGRAAIVPPRSTTYDFTGNFHVKNESVPRAAIPPCVESIRATLTHPADGRAARTL